MVRMGTAFVRKVQLLQSAQSSSGEHNQWSRLCPSSFRASRKTAASQGRIRIAKKQCPEALKLLVLCAQSRPSAEDAKSIRCLCSGLTEWNGVLALASRHRLLPLLAHTLQTLCYGCIPDEVLLYLRSSLAASARINLQLAARLIEVLDALGAQGVRVIPYKGPVLGSMLYDNPALRPTTDLDLLIRKPDLGRASAVLRDLGFHPPHALNNAQQSSLARTDCEYLFCGPDGVQVDLHWRIAPELYGVRFDEQGLWSRLQATTWAGRDSAVFSPEDLLLCLCQHAAKHLWSELILLADIAELVRSRPTLDWDFIFEQAKWSRSERILSCSLMLICQLWRLELTDRVIDRLTVDCGSLELVDEVAADLEKSVSGPQEVWRTHHLNSRLRRSWRERMHYWLSVIGNPTLAEFDALHLPVPLTHFYVPFRFCRLLRKCLQGVLTCHA